MVGAAREEEVAAPRNVVITPTCAAAAAILPRRILFHPSLKAPLPTSSQALTLTPLNLPPPPLSSSSAAAILDDLSHHKASLHPLTPLPTMLIQQIGAGLNNLGNTCFLNAVLQCLTYTPPLAAYFKAGSHQGSCRSVGFCAMCALESHVKQALSARGRVISPNQLVKNLRCISRSFQMGRQEDSHEYMRYLIEALQKSCPLEAHANASSSSHRNFIQRIFGGRLRSQVKCTQCSHSSNTYDPFLDLSLDIVKAESLLKALARFTAIEVLDGNNKYHCSKCKTKVRAHKQFTINNAPHVLTVQFKRFSSSGGCGGKIDKRVQFDRSFNLMPFVNGGKEGGLRYSLYAVLVHSGWSTHSGHYFCFVRTATDIWHKLDDNRVSQVSEKSVLEQKAYILFYIRDSEVLPTSNGNDYGTRSERFSVPNGTSDVAKVKANGMSVHEDMKGNLHMGSNQNGNIDNNAVRSLSGFSNTIANGPGNNVPIVLNGVEVWANGNKVRAPASSTTKACNPAPAEVMGKEHSAKVEANHVFNLSNNHVGNNNDNVLNNGELQRIGNGLSTRSEEKTCTLVPPEVKSHLPNGIGVPENSCLTEKKVKRNEVFHHQISGNGSVKRICPTYVKEVDAKEDLLQRLETQADSTTNVLSKAVCDQQTVGRPMSCSALPLSSFDTTVPRWEDAEESKANTLEQQNLMAETVAHCGHVLDKWDEEYDRGKRKKLRSRKGVLQGISGVSDCLHIHKKRKKDCLFSLEHGSTVPMSNEDCHDNVFQVFAGKKAQPGFDTGRLKKPRKRQRGLCHKLFLKRHRFRQLHANRQHRRKC